MITVPRVLAGLLVVIAVSGLGFWLTQNKEQPLIQTEPDSAEVPLQPPPLPDIQLAPAGASEQDDSQLLAPPAAPALNLDADTNDQSSVESSTNVDVTALGRSELSESELQALLLQLQDNPQLLAQLIDEIRQETDPQRLDLLSRILGEVGGESVTLLASEWIFSGNAASRERGLELLQMVQPGNPEARDIVSSMLATEVEPDVLVGTLTTLAVPGDVDDYSRAYLADQVAWLTDHGDASVRSISLDILSRWTNDDQYTHVLLAGLDDDSEYVRKSAAYSLVKHEDPNPQVIERLMRTATDESEVESVRRAAILALYNMPITEQQRQSLGSVEQNLNTVVR